MHVFCSTLCNTFLTCWVYLLFIYSIFSGYVWVEHEDVVEAVADTIARVIRYSPEVAGLNERELQARLVTTFEDLRAKGAGMTSSVCLRLPLLCLIHDGVLYLPCSWTAVGSRHEALLTLRLGNVCVFIVSRASRGHRRATDFVFGV